jgi:hypothetical protein
MISQYFTRPNFARVGDTGGRFWSKMKDRSRGLSVIDHVVMAKSNSSVTSIWRLTETFDSSFDSVFLPFSVRCRCAAFCSSTRFSFLRRLVRLQFCQCRNRIAFEPPWEASAK